MTDTYSQPDAPDPVWSHDVVLDVVRRHVPGAEEVTGVDESGGEARAYLVDADVVLKIQRPHRLRPRTSLEKEAFILEGLAPEHDLPVPRVLGYGRHADTDYLAMTRVPGVALSTTALTGEARVAVLHSLGRVLRRFHEVDQTAMATSPLIPGDRSATDLRTRLADGFERVRQVLAADPTAVSLNVPARIARCLEQLPTATPPVTLHSNPGAEHTFVDPNTGTFAGLIDFGDAYRSHPAMDVRSWASLTDSRHLFDGYRSAGALPEGFADVWRAGMTLTELSLVARGWRNAADAARALSEIERRGGPPDT